MKLLVVDDQMSVADGIKEQIAWEECGIDQVFSAYNATEAKQILRIYSIDIMLCDIEMPNENGIELLKWTYEEKLKTKTIMLTGHAEFIYAQQAMRYGSVDYLLQPASYDEIKKVVMKVADDIRKNHILLTFSDIGQNIMENKNNIAQAILFYALRDGQCQFEIADTLDLFPQPAQEFWMISFQVLKWEKDSGRWTDEQMLFALNNVLDELLAPYNQKFLVIQNAPQNYSGIIWGEELISLRFLSRQIEFFLNICENYRAFSMAIYVARCIDRDHIGDAWKEILDMREANVLQNPGLYAEKVLKKSEYHFVDKKRWVEQLKSGCGETTRFEAKQFLHKMQVEEALNKENLKHYYLDFLQVAYAAAGTENSLMEKILLSDEDFRLYYGGFQTVEMMEKLIDRIIDGFAQNTESAEEEDVVSRTERYIHEHLKDALRRDEVAEIMNISGDYLSKLFKKKYNLSLKEYILEEKMNQAKVLLQTTNLPVSVIALMVGYDNFSHFTQIYKKHTGERPLDTRERKEP